MATRVERLAWRDIPYGEIDLPKKKLQLTLGLGSGLTRRPNDAAGRVFAVTDRGPNMFASTAVEYGLAAEHLRGTDAKIMPTPEAGPEIAELAIEAGAIRFVRRIPLRTASGLRLNGLPPPAGDLQGELVELVCGLDGKPVDASEARHLGADAEAIAAMPDGGFFIAEEYRPSLLKADANGVVSERWVAEGHAPDPTGSDLPTRAVLPREITLRRPNRGLEALCASPDGAWLYACLQSAPRGANQRFTPIWKLDARTGALAGRWDYPLDDPLLFLRDASRRRVGLDDLKVCEFAWAGEDCLIVLERISHSSRIHFVDLARLPKKHLLLSSDDHPEIGPDIEGMTLLSPAEILISSDNDFGVEGAETGFWRILLDAPLPAR